jgi:hypothetical protein
MSAARLHRITRAAVGSASVLAQVALAFFYVGLAMFIAPEPWVLVFWLAWAAAVIAVIWLAIRHTWFAPLVPIASLIAWTLLYDYGVTSLGWGA